MTSREVRRLRTAEFTYPEVGSSREADLPGGYRHLNRSCRLGTGEARFHQAAQAVLGWDMHRRAGLEVSPSNEHVVEGAVAVLRLGVGTLRVAAPVRVVYVVDDARRKGFAYGTLPGHPERGEEAFMVELQDDEAVTFTITAFSRPATLLARLGGPVSRGVQSWMTTRYMRAV